MVSIKHNLGRYSFPRRLSHPNDKKHKGSQPTQFAEEPTPVFMPSRVSFLHQDKEALKERRLANDHNQNTAYNKDKAVVVTRSVHSSTGNTTTHTWVRLRYPLFSFFPRGPTNNSPTGNLVNPQQSGTALISNEFQGNSALSSSFAPTFVHYSFSSILLFTSFREMNIAALREAADSIWSHDRPKAHENVPET